MSSIGGSRVIQHWDVPDEKNAAKKGPRRRQGRCADPLADLAARRGDRKLRPDLAVEHNPNIRITVQEFWLPNDTFHPVYPLETRKKVDHNAAIDPELKKQNDLYRETIEAHVRDVNQRLKTSCSGRRPGWPGGDCPAPKNHRPPGAAVKVQWSLFTDDWGHPAPPLKVLAAYCHFAVIYRRSPVGLPLPLELEQNRQYATPALNRLLQELAWNAVVQNPLSGVSS